MSVIFRILSTTILILGTLLVIQIASPQTLVKAREKLPPSLRAKIDYLADVGSKSIGKVLGEKSNSIKIDAISQQILENEVFLNTQKEVNKTISNLVNNISNLPEEQAKKVKKEVKRKVCEEWLKE